jgi:hypothetical protein
MAAPPVWLLDVDGVLNASRAGWSAAPNSVGVWAYGERFRLRFSPQLVDRIAALHRERIVEIRWATSWVGRTDSVSTALGLPQFPDAFTYAGSRPPSPGNTLLAKTRAAHDVITIEGRRLIWTDDDAIPRIGPYRAALDAAGALLIAPKPNRGLRPEHLDQIEAYARHPSLVILTGTDHLAPPPD